MRPSWFSLLGPFALVLLAFRFEQRMRRAMGWRTWPGRPEGRR